MAGRLTASGLTAHPLRARLLQLVSEAGPAGARLAFLARETGASRNTVDYHLAMLGRHGLVQRRADRPGGPCRYALPNRPAPSTAVLAAREVAENRLSALLLDLVKERPGATVTDLSRSAALHPSHTMYWLRRMLAANLVAAEKTGRVRRVYPLTQPPVPGPPALADSNGAYHASAQTVP